MPGGDDVPGYLDQEGAARGFPSPRPTPRCAWKWTNWRWAGVPFYLRTGKRLARKVTEIAVTLKPVPHWPSARTAGLRACSTTSWC